jgi:hypothetical protein
MGRLLNNIFEDSRRYRLRSGSYVPFPSSSGGGTKAPSLIPFSSSTIYALMLPGHSTDALTSVCSGNTSSTPDASWSQSTDSCWSYICTWLRTCQLMFGNLIERLTTEKASHVGEKGKHDTAGSFSSWLRPHLTRRLLKPTLAQFCLPNTPIFSKWLLHTPTQLLVPIGLPMKPGEKEKRTNGNCATSFPLPSCPYKINIPTDSSFCLATCPHTSFLLG